MLQRCYKNRDQMTPFRELKMGEAFEKTLERTPFLRAQGYEVVEKWECDLMHELKADHEMKTFFTSMDIVEPMKVSLASLFSKQPNQQSLFRCVTVSLEEGRKHCNSTGR